MFKICCNIIVKRDQTSNNEGSINSLINFILKFNKEAFIMNHSQVPRQRFSQSFSTTKRIPFIPFNINPRFPIPSIVLKSDQVISASSSIKDVDVPGRLQGSEGTRS